MASALVTFVVLVTGSLVVAGTPTMINNLVPRLDNQGNIMDRRVRVCDQSE